MRKAVLDANDLLLLKGTYPSLTSKGGENQRDILMEYQDKARYGLELETNVSDSEPEKEELLRSERYQNLSRDAQLAITANISNDELLKM